MKLLIMQSSTAFRHRLRFKYSPQHLFSNTLSPCSSFCVLDQVSHPYKTIGKITAVHSVHFSPCVFTEKTRRQKTEQKVSKHCLNLKVKFKVNLSLCLTLHHAMQTYWRSGGYSSTHSSTSVLDGGEWSASCPCRFTPPTPGKSPLLLISFPFTHHSVTIRPHYVSKESCTDKSTLLYKD
jgi:hypothetical protein